MGSSYLPSSLLFHLKRYLESLTPNPYGANGMNQLSSLNFSVNNTKIQGEKESGMVYTEVKIRKGRRNGNSTDLYQYFH